MTGSMWMKLSKLSNRMKEGRQVLDSCSFIYHDSEYGFYSKCDGKPLDGFEQGRDIISHMFLLSLLLSLVIRIVIYRMNFRDARMKAVV